MSSETQNQVLEFTRKQETIDSALEKIRAGFCLKSEITAAEIGFIFENYEHASTIRITSAGLHGGRHYSIYDLLGHSVNVMNYIVTEHTSFNHYMSLKLEEDFMKKNPKADSRIRASFTSFMHENKLHWSKCCGNHSIQQNRVIREKLRTLSIKTGKSHAQILSELLDNALNQMRY
jgi:hypothetical protein